jgi:hypothetical protein
MTLAAYDGGENEITGHREEGSYFMGARLHLFEGIKIAGACITFPYEWGLVEQNLLLTVGTL